MFLSGCGKLSFGSLTLPSGWNLHEENPFHIHNFLEKDNSQWKSHFSSLPLELSDGSSLIKSLKEREYSLEYSLDYSRTFKIIYREVSQTKWNEYFPFADNDVEEQIRCAYIYCCFFPIAIEGWMAHFPISIQVVNYIHSLILQLKHSFRTKLFGCIALWSNGQGFEAWWGFHTINRINNAKFVLPYEPLVSQLHHPSYARPSIDFSHYVNYVFSSALFSNFPSVFSMR